MLRGHMNTNLKNRCVWITGASSGIGAAVAKEFAARGALVALTARRVELLSEVVAAIEAAGGKAAAFPGDVMDLPGLKVIAQKIESEFSPLDIVIANAGSHIESKPEEFESQVYIDLMSLNYGGMLRTFDAAIPFLKSRSRGQLVGVASLAGYRGLPKAAAYGASKAAMIYFMDSIRFHLRRHGVTVSCVNPGFVKTPLTDQNDFYMPFLMSPEDAAKATVDGIVARRAEITYPFLFSRILKIGRLLPRVVYEAIVDRMW